MRCDRCGAENGTDRRFCGQCGMPLSRPCPTCGTGNEPGARFCGGCARPLGDSLGSPSSADEGPGSERKVATILFADIVGYTSLGERHDPELVQALVSHTFDRLSSEVEAFGGLIEKFAGDAILALFGVPVAHEDDPERAIRAAIEMQRAIASLSAEMARDGGPPVELRVGVETGEVLVDLERAFRGRDRLVTGDAVNTAARLQQSAPVGAVVVGPRLHAATRAIVEYEALEPVVLKGKEHPTACWRVVTLVGGRGRRSPFGREAPLVGREAELTLLQDTVRRSNSERRPHLVTVLGPAGIGKSRLVWELERYVTGLPQALLWRKGRCLPYGQANYSALAEAIKADAGVLDDDEPEAAGAKLDARLAQVFDGEADGTIRDRARAALRALVALDGDTALARDELFEAWREYLERLAIRAPLLLVLEDVHWADEGLLDFIDFMVRWADAPITIICLTRHELLERRPVWAGGLRNAISIVLEPLDRAQVVRLLDSLLGDSVSEAVRERIATTADGNPLFTEELARMLSDEPSVGARIPQSIQALLTARLDSLPPAEKRLAQQAAVIGRFFWDGALAYLAGTDPSATRRGLRGLREKQLVVARDRSSLSGEAEFGFRHVLIRDVAYETLPKRVRARLHLGVARWAEERFAERPEDVVELLAAHYLSTLEYEEALPGSGQLDLPALRRSVLEHARQAGRRAARLWQLETASRWMRVAVEQGRQIPLPDAELAALILEHLEAAEGYETVDATLQASEEALRLLGRSASEHELVGRLSAIRADAQAGAANPSQAVVTLRSALARVDAGPATAQRAWLRSQLGRALRRAGADAEAVEQLEIALVEARKVGADRAERWALQDLAILPHEMGRPSAEMALAERSLEHARAAGDRGLLLRSYNNTAATILLLGGDWHRAVELYEEGLGEARRIGDNTWRIELQGNLGGLLAWLGRIDDAVRHTSEALALADAQGETAELAYRLIEAAYARVMRGEHDAARILMERVANVPVDERALTRLQATFTRALLDWPVRPVRAVVELTDAIRDVGDVRGAPADTACQWQIRMAFRTGVIKEGRVGLDLLQRWGRPVAGPARARLRWLEALLAGLSTEALVAVERAATELAAEGHPLSAADAFADAALLAARAGLPTDGYQQRAEHLYERCGAVPALGRLPEPPQMIDASERERDPGEEAGAMRARLESIRSYAQLLDQDVEAALTALLQQLTELDDRPPSAERAWVLARLGRALWRTGDSRQAIARLEQALDEARVTGAADAERWAMHDLGISLANTGRETEGRRLLEGSMELARQARDRALLMRCYVNLPAYLDDVGEATGMLENGLSLAEASVDREMILKFHLNLASTLTDLGRLGEAARHAREAILISDVVGAHAGNARSVAGRVALAQGRREDAHRLFDEARQLQPAKSPVDRMYDAYLGSCLAWLDAPDRAVSDLSRAINVVEVAEEDVTALGPVLLMLGRMAFRTGRADVTSGAANKIPSLEGSFGSVLGRWTKAIAGDPAEAVDELRAVAADLAAMGQRVLDADALADAALAAVLSGVPDQPLTEDAVALYRDMGVTPLLGELPETRWVDRAGGMGRGVDGPSAGVDGRSSPVQDLGADGVPRR